MSRSGHLTSTHRYPAISNRGNSPFGTLLGWYETPTEAAAVVETFRTAKPVSLKDLLGGK